MSLGDKIKGLCKKLVVNPIKSTLLVGSLALILTTTLKDNVYYKGIGPVQLNNFNGNQYVWGIIPLTKINGNVKGNVSTYGIFAGFNDVNHDYSTVNGNIKSYGLLIGANYVGTNSTVNGDIKSYGLFAGMNNVGTNSTVNGKITALGLIGGINRLMCKSKISKDATGLALLIGRNSIEDDVSVGENLKKDK